MSRAIKELKQELSFSVSRSGGPGGQNVNKVNSKVTIKFDVINSQVLTPEEKEIIKKKLSTKLTKEGILVLTSQESRSQLENKEEVLKKFEALIIRAFIKQKSRKPTKPSKGAVQRRIKSKKQLSEKKEWRRKV
jgi:ribosome-associated protein